MKKLFFYLVAMCGLVTVSNAQGVGQFWAGGSVGVWHESVKDGDDYTSFKILPEFGYIISENIGVGVSLGYMHNEGKYEKFGEVDARSLESNGFTISPFVRYTFLKGDIGSLFVDGGGSYTYLKDKDQANIKTNAFEVGFKPGVAVKVSNNVAILGKFGFLGYQHSKVGSEKINSFGLDFDMSQFELGANIVF